MKYKTLLEFCEMLLATEADESILAERHVDPTGYIARIWGRVMDAIHNQEELDFRAYIEELIDSNPAKKDRLN